MINGQLAKLDMESVLTRGSEFELPKDLFSYQKEDGERILRASWNTMNLSEMGTGKTPTAISVAELGGFKNVLIICPKSLRLEWQRQIQQWSENNAIPCRRGSGRRLDPMFTAIRDKVQFKYFILNYETFRIARHRELVKMYPWDLIILDEVHQIRNPETSMTKGLLEFIESHKDRLIVPMTGSPIVNSALDMYTLLMITDPDSHRLSTRHEFLDAYTYWTPGRNRPKVFGLRQPDAFRRYIDPRIILRKKSECLQHLPDKYYRRVILDMDDEQREVYDNLVADLMVELDNGEEFYVPSVLALLTRLRQVNLDPRIIGVNAPSSKTEFFRDLVKDGPEKLVVFSTFDQYIQLLEKELQSRELGLSDYPNSYISITGRTPGDQISSMIQRFQEDPLCRVALGTVKVMGQGITLTAASDVVLMDRWWTPAANNQAIDRLHRPGQKNAVQVVMPTNEGSIDQVLDEILKRKQSETDLMLNDQTIIEEVLEDLRQMVYR